MLKRNSVSGVFAVVLAVSAAGGFADHIITDVVDGDGAWMAYSGIGGGFALASGLTPTAGTNYFKVVSTATIKRGSISKDFGTVIHAGVYTVTFDAGIDTSGSALIPDARLAFGFFDPDYTNGSGYSVTAGTATNSNTYVSEAINAFSALPGVTRTIERSTDPAPGGWSTWEVKYIVSAGSAAIGQAVHFGFWAATLSTGGQIQFDNLNADYEANVLNTWAPPAGTAASSVFSVSVRKAGETNWTNVFVYDVKVGHQDGSTQDTSMTCFDFFGTVDVKVTYLSGAVSAYEVRPISYGINPVQAGQTLTFSMTQDMDSPRKAVLRINNSWDTKVLHILTNPPETGAPSETDTNVYVVNPGVSAPYELPDGKDTYYFKPGVHTLPQGLWLDLDLQSVHSINQITLVQAPHAGVEVENRFIVKTKVLPGDSYTTTYNGMANSSTGTVTVSFAPTDARYVHLTLLGNNDPNDYYFASQLKEFQVFESGNPTNLALKNAVAGAIPTYPNAVDGNPATLYKTSSGYSSTHAGEPFFLAKSGTAVYIAGGAIVHGAFMSDSVNNITVKGRGILDGSQLRHTYTTQAEEKTGLIWLISGSDNRVEGITMLDSPMWSTVMNFSTRPVVQDINFIGCNVNADGVHLSGCTSGTVSGVFIRTPDDNFVMYHYAAASWNTVQNSVLWNDDARNVLLGLAGNGTQPISHIIFKNLDILNQQGVWDLEKFNGCFQLRPNGGNLISDITFSDIRIDPFKDPTQSVVFQFRCNELNPGDGNGSLQNIVVSNLTYRGSSERVSLLQGVDAAHNIDGVYFYNYLRQNTYVTNAASGNITVTPNVSNVCYDYNTSPVISEGDSVAVSMSEDGVPNAFSLTLHASDAEADTLTWSVSVPAAHGTAGASGAGATKAISYTPDTNYNGTDSFTVQVSDGRGGTDAIIVHVTITAVNDAPVVSITSPASGTDFTAPVSITLQADASDVDGTVTQVAFYSDAVLIGTAHTAPWTYTWTNVPEGAYSLSARSCR